MNTRQTLSFSWMRAAKALGVAALAAAFLAVPAHGSGPKAKKAADRKPLVSKTWGEEWAIRKREEWFYAPRRAGAEGKMAALRAEAVRFTRLQQEACAPEGAGFWTCRGPSSANMGSWAFGKISGRIPALAMDWYTGVLYVGSATGGVWKSTDGGASWTPIFDSPGTQTIGALAVDPNHPGTLWVGTGENTVWSCEGYFGIGLYRTTDGGEHWEARNGDPGGTLDGLSEFCAISLDPRNSNHLLVGGIQRSCSTGWPDFGGVYRSTNGGQHWDRVLNARATCVVRDTLNPDIIWAGLRGESVHRSLDGGEHWTQVTGSGLPTGSNVAGRVEIAVSPYNSNYVYVLFEKDAEHNRPELWRTTDGGTTWEERCSGTDACDGQCGYNMTLRALNNTTLLRGTIHIFKSTDGGSSWTDLSGPWGATQKVHQDTHLLLMNPVDSSEFWVGCDGGIWRTNNGGSTFTNLNANLNLTQFYDIAIHPWSDEVIIGGSQDNSSLARTASDTWDLQLDTADGFVGLIATDNPDWVYAESYAWDCGGGAIYPSVHRSKAGLFGPYIWITKPGCGIDPTPRIAWVTPYTLAPADPTTLYLGTHRMYRSTDRGDTWVPVGPADMTGGGTACIVTVNVSRTDPSFVYGGTYDGRVWQSTDGGTFWVDISAGLPYRTITDIDPVPTDGFTAFCTVSGFNTSHLWRYAGSGWVARGGGLPNVPANTVLALSASEVFVGTDTGIFRSTDGGVSFLPFNEGLPAGLIITDMEYNASTHTITAGTYGRGAWQYSYALPGEVGTTEVSALRWATGTRNKLVWGAVSGAQGYRVYRGLGELLWKLPTPAGAAVCVAYDGPAADTGKTLQAEPAPGTFYWYLAAAYNVAGEGSPGSGSSTPRNLNVGAPCSPP